MDTSSKTANGQATQMDQHWSNGDNKSTSGSHTPITFSKSLPDLPAYLVSGTKGRPPFCRATSIHVCDHEVLAHCSLASEYGSSDDFCADAESKVTCMPICRILTKSIESDTKTKKYKQPKDKSSSNKSKPREQSSRRCRLTKSFTRKRGKGKKEKDLSEDSDVRSKKGPQDFINICTSTKDAADIGTEEEQCANTASQGDEITQDSEQFDSCSEQSPDVDKCSDLKFSEDSSSMLQVKFCVGTSSEDEVSSTRSNCANEYAASTGQESEQISNNTQASDDDVKSTSNIENILCNLVRTASTDDLDQSDLYYDMDSETSDSDADSDIATESDILFMPHMGDLQEGVVCKICFETKPLYLRYCCNTPVCDQCMNSFCMYIVDGGSIKFPCPSNECSQPIYQGEVFARLDNDHKEKLYRYLINANTDPHKKTCPKCSDVLTLDSLDELQTKRVKRHGFLVTCKRCGLEWCFPCQSPWHPKITCKKNRRGDALLRSWAKEMKAGQVNARKCPKCKIFIQRSTGCDHMTCSKCGVSFCYRCGERFRHFRFLGNHYSRLGIFGCKYLFLPKHPVLRRLIRGTIFGAELLVLPVVAALLVAGGVLLLAGATVASPILMGISVRRYREKVRQRQLRLARIEHDRQTTERIRNMGDPYLENYQFLEDNGVNKIWDLSGRTRHDLTEV